jgi:L-asparaginase
MVGHDRLDLAWYQDHATRLDVGDLLRRIPEAQSFARVEPVSFPRFRSPAITPADWIRLSREVGSAIEDDRVAGLVATHGTNTLEETAYFLSLTLKAHKTVVLTGSMRPASAMSGDGDLNLVNSIRVAASSEARDLGVLVVMNDTIFAARDVMKAATYRLDAFQSPEGPLGCADADGRVVVYRRPTRRHTVDTPFDPSKLDDLPRVDIILSYIGATGDLIDAAVEGGAQGIVLAGTGSGSCSDDEERAADRAVASGIAVIRSSRVGSGRVVSSPRMRSRGMVAADDLSPWKARVLLMLGLTMTVDYAELQAMFDRY